MTVNVMPGMTETDNGTLIISISELPKVFDDVLPVAFIGLHGPWDRIEITP